MGFPGRPLGHLFVDSEEQISHALEILLYLLEGNVCSVPGIHARLNPNQINGLLTSHIFCTH